MSVVDDQAKVLEEDWSTNPRWKGVPIYLRTAKRLHESGTNISVKFKNTCSLIGDSNNWFIFNIQPGESSTIVLTTKTPGLDDQELRLTKLEGSNRIDGDESIDAYETLMLDLLNGNQSRFLHIDEVKAQWSFVDPIINYWTQNKEKLHQYISGSADPESSKVIFEDPSQFWR